MYSLEKVNVNQGEKSESVSKIIPAVNNAFRDMCIGINITHIYVCRKLETQFDTPGDGGNWREIP
jgi:hypothetical protein